MTKRGHIELTSEDRQQMARLMYLHLETHPARIGQLFGVGAQYVRQQWREHLLSELSDDGTALKALRDRLSRWPRVNRKKHGKADPQSSKSAA